MRKRERRPKGGSGTAKRGPLIFISRRLGMKQGRLDGAAAGWADGYRLGRAEVIGQQVAAGTAAVRELRVLFITSGLGVPHDAIDEAVLHGLQQSVREVAVASPHDDLAALAASLRPNVAIAMHGHQLSAERALALRMTGVPLAVWFSDDPYHTDWSAKLAPHVDHVFTLESSCVSLYRELGCVNVHHLPLGMDPRQYAPRRPEPAQRADIVFIGSAFWNRVQMIDAIAPYLARKRTVISGYWWERLSRLELLKDRIRSGPWMTAEETAGWYNGAKIVINIHRAPDDPTTDENSRNLPAYSVNPRTFEIAGCATLQLTDVRPDLPNVYAPESEIATFQSPEELQERLEYYLTHEDVRRETALRGYARTMREHTYACRVSKLLQAIFG